MEIRKPLIEKRTRLFSEYKPGDIFLCGNLLTMKTEEVYGRTPTRAWVPGVRPPDTVHRANAVVLCDGRMTHFSDSETVVEASAYVVME